METSAPLELTLILGAAAAIPTLTPALVADRLRVGIHVRVAPNPWGPWSVPRLAYNALSTLYPGFCELLHFADSEHIPKELFGLSENETAEDFCGDRAAARGSTPFAMKFFNGILGARGPNGLVELGGEYGPGIIDPLVTAIPATSRDGPAISLYWIQSTWVPYRVVMMRTTVGFANRSPDRVGIPTTFNPDACLFGCCVMHCGCFQGLCPP